MKPWFSPTPSYLLAASTGAALLLTAGLQAAEITYDTTGSGAYQQATNWAGDVLPGADDIAQIGNATINTGILSINLSHAAYPSPKNQIHSAAIRVLSERTNDLTLRSNNNSNSSYYLYGATINDIADTILVNESSAHLSIEPLTGNNNGTMSLVLRADESHVIQARGSGGITILAPITGSGSSLIINSSGTGVVTLSGSSSYSGGTTVRNGALAITTDSAIGTGALTLAGGSASISAGVTLSQPIQFTGNAVLQTNYNSGSSLSGYQVESALGARNTVASLLGGTTTASRTLTSGFAASSAASNDELRSSDTFTLTGMDGDVFVLELKLTDSSLGEGSYLAWLNADNEWVNAIDGNTALGEDALFSFNGSFDSAGITASADTLGSWGYDLANQSVWAILDHNSAFSVVAIPEPATFLLLAGGLGLLAFRHTRRRSPLRSCSLPSRLHDAKG